jgi:hypothetical protein
MANSYLGDSLDVYSARRQLVYDPTLRDMLAPRIQAPRWKGFFTLGLKGLIPVSAGAIAASSVVPDAIAYLMQ